jgi:cation diffusion facilitator family transporter
MYRKANPHEETNDSSLSSRDPEDWTKMSITDSASNKHDNNSKIASFATTASWIVNWLLLFIKIVALIISSSKAVAAALADSAVDLVSQFVLSLAERYMSRHNPDYPVGRSRLEALSVLASASIMTMASTEVIQFSVIDLINGINGNIPKLNADILVICLLGIGIFLKIFLYVFCTWAQKILDSDVLVALSEDHLNDVMSNSVAIGTVLIAVKVSNLWWFDPVGAIIISLIIIYRWACIMIEQVKKIVGHTAPTEFIQQVEEIANQHDSRLAVDCIRAYHFGARCKCSYVINSTNFSYIINTIYNII